ncbi:MAG: hypothetical protein IJ563_11420 [Selenomonadaceae bacterium]|nr:hypothetical protein [Selenomonadaceae bacterium]
MMRIVDGVPVNVDGCDDISDEAIRFKMHCVKNVYKDIRHFHHFYINVYEHGGRKFVTCSWSAFSAASAIFGEYIPIS